MNQQLIHDLISIIEKDGLPFALQAPRSLHSLRVASRPQGEGKAARARY